MPIDWGDPGLYTAGAGTGLGILSAVLPYLSHPGQFQAAQAQRNALDQQRQAMAMATNKEAQAQALAGKPLDPTAYYNQLTGAGTDAIRRQYMANALSTQSGAAMDPQLAERTWLTEKLPMYSSDMMQRALGFAQGDRSNQLQAIMWNPAIQAMLQNYGLGVPMQYAQMLSGNAPHSATGDVSALGAYFQNQKMMETQKQANKSQSGLYDTMTQYLQRGLNRQATAPLGTAYTGGLGEDSGTAKNTYLDTAAAGGM